MKSASFSTPSLSLAWQGTILIAVMLAFELLFVGVLGLLVQQAEDEATRQMRAQDIDTKSSQLLLTIYDTGNSVGEFTRTLQFGATKRFESSKVEVTSLLDALKEDLKDDEHMQPVLNRLEQNIKICQPVMTRIKEETAHLDREEAANLWRQGMTQVVAGKKTVRDLVDTELIPDTTHLMSEARKIEQEKPDLERRHRDLVKTALLIGLVINILFGIAVVLFFTGRIVSRLNVLVDNTKRLKEGMALNHQLEGRDEIAQVDAVFHETAAVLQKEEKILKASEARVRAIIENVPVGVMLLSPIGTIEFTNPTLQKTFGFESHELLGKSVTKLLPSEKIAGGTQFVSELSKKALGHIIEIQAQHRDGHEVPIDFTMAEVTLSAGGDAQIMAMTLDATERYEIKKLRQSFVQMVSEELRTPLTKVSDFLGKFGSGKFGEMPEKAVDQCQKSEQNIERLITLLNDLFDLEKLESGKIDITKAPASLQAILDKSLNAVSMFAQKHNVTVEIPQTELQLYVDSNRIVQILVNLLSNAIKFSPAQSKVTIAVKQSDSQLELMVIDKGRGIPASHIGSMFQKFQQVEAGDAKKKGGTGLGLVICRAIVEEHGGTIGVDSEEGKGSTFWIRLPQEAIIRS
ncbi:MAG: ATP-binding protein [Candidatus Obscuribacterales bacterium]